MPTPLTQYEDEDILWQYSLRQLLNGTTYRVLELILLGVVVPSLILFFKLAPHLLLFLWGTFLYCLLVFYFLESSESQKKLRLTVSVEFFGFIVLRWVLFSLVLYLFTVFIFPEKLFLIQRTNPGFIWKILIFYPVFSALPQEFIFCKFFFARYRNFFGEKTFMVLMSSLAFCFAHLLFINWVAPVLGFVAGIIFARTYQRTKSLLLVSLEHSLYGDTLFFIGLGWFFWGGSIV